MCLRRASPALLVSCFIITVFVLSRVPLMSRAIRHGWYVDMNAQYHPMVMARAFVQEGGRTPFLLFPIFSARAGREEPWWIYTSWPPLAYYALTPVMLVTKNPHAQIFLARLGATLVMAAGSLLVFGLFRAITQNDALALVAQVFSTFEFDRYYFADLPFGSQYGYVLGLLQTLLFWEIVRGSVSKRHLWGAHVVSAVGAMTWWVNSLIPLTALALSYGVRVSPDARRTLRNVAVSSTLVALAVFSWLAVTEISTTGVVRGGGAVGAGLYGLSNPVRNWVNLLTRLGPIPIAQTYMEFFLRFVLPPFPVLGSNFSLGQQMTAFGLMPRMSFTVDQIVTVPLVVSLFVCFSILVVRGARGWLNRVCDGGERRDLLFGVCLFAFPGVLFVLLLPGWTYGHHPYGRIALTPLAVMLALAAYSGAAGFVRRRRAVVLTAWLAVWAASGVSLSYSMVKQFDDGYNRAELAALDWFREHVPPASVLINNIPAYDDIYSTFDLFYADARAYTWPGWAYRLATPTATLRWPNSSDVRPYLERVNVALSSLRGDPAVLRARKNVQAALTVIAESNQEEIDHERQLQILDLYGEMFASLRSVNRELLARGLTPLPLPLPLSWKKNNNYLLFREDLGLPPLFRGMDYVVKFESQFSTAPAVFLGGRTAYLLICGEDVDVRRLPMRCRHALRKAIAAGLRGDRRSIGSLSFITAGPSGDNLEVPVRGEAGSVGKMLLVKLEGE